MWHCSWESLAAGRWAYDGAACAGHAEMSAWHQVPAVLLTTPFVQQVACLQPRPGQDGPTRAPRTGWVRAPAGSVAGTTVQ